MDNLEINTNVVFAVFEDGTNILNVNNDKGDPTPFKWGKIFGAIIDYLKKAKPNEVVCFCLAELFAQAEIKAIMRKTIDEIHEEK